MNSAQFNQMMEQGRMSSEATKPAEGPAEGEVWLDISGDGDVISIGENCDYKSGSDFLYSKFKGYAKAGDHPFEALAYDLDMEPDDLFDMLLEGADEGEITDVLLEAYNGQEG